MPSVEHQVVMFRRNRRSSDDDQRLRELKLIVVENLIAAPAAVEAIVEYQVSAASGGVTRRGQ